jgi:hypothetical protein
MRVEKTENGNPHVKLQGAQRIEIFTAETQRTNKK